MDHERKRDKGWAIACEKEKQVDPQTWALVLGWNRDWCMHMHGDGRKMEQRNWREIEEERQETVRHRSQGRGGQTVGLETDPAGQREGARLDTDRRRTFHWGAPFLPPPLSHSSTQSVSCRKGFEGAGVGMTMWWQGGLRCGVWLRVEGVQAWVSGPILKGTGWLAGECYWLKCYDSLCYWLRCEYLV